MRWRMQEYNRERSKAFKSKQVKKNSKVQQFSATNRQNRKKTYKHYSIKDTGSVSV